MQPNSKFKNLGLEFWAVVKLLNQRLGYAERKSKEIPNPSFVIPTIAQVIKVFKSEGLDYGHLIDKGNWTPQGQLLVDYMEYRKGVLTNEVKTNLMRVADAKAIFHQLKSTLNPACPLPFNKQKGAKKDHSFLTGIVNILIEQAIVGTPCNYDPRELTAFTQGGFPVRTLSRRVDGAFPSVINPIAIWEIKEYYYTTSFGSRIADGVYETQLDGWELNEIEKNLQIDVEHYLIVDDYSTWWEQGRSYLCRLIDAMHMGLVTEVIFGKEVVTRIPAITQQWLSKYAIQQALKPKDAAIITDSQLPLGI
jgi:hypothetical protein